MTKSQEAYAMEEPIAVRERGVQGVHVSQSLTGIKAYMSRLPNLTL